MDPQSPGPRSTKTHTRRRLIVGTLAGVLVLGAMLLLAVSPALAPPVSFPDVPASHPYYTAITDLASRGIMKGYTNGNFGPADPVLRQQFAKMIVLTAGYPVSAADVCPFPDVDKSIPPDLYPDHYVAVAAAHGITVGTSPGLFSPGKHISRYQVISMVVRAADDLHPGLLAAPPASFSGTPGWADNPTHGANARRAEYNGLLAGLPLASLDPWGDMSRGEVAQVLHNLLQLLPPTTTTTAGAFEEHPFWSTSNLAVTAVWSSAERTDPDQQVTLTAQVENRGPADATTALVEFSVDGTVVYQAIIHHLPVGGTTFAEGTWWARGAGRHTLRAEVKATGDTLDLDASSNWAEAGIWVSGEANPEPTWLVQMPDFSLLGLNPGTAGTIPIMVRNPSFATTEAVPIRFYIDDQEVDEGLVEPLAPGGRQYFDVPWAPSPGVHVVKVVLAADPPLPDAVAVSTALLIVPGQGPLYPYPAGKDQWASMGPQILKTGDAGRMADAVFDPLTPSTAYAVSEVGGIWKTTNLGDSWFPIGDKLPTMQFALIAVDPKHPQIVYALSYDQGLWKSTDGGVNWTHFAGGVRDGDSTYTMIDPKALVVRHPNAESEQVVVYVACMNGVLRYVSNDPWQPEGATADWKRILDGPVWDLAVYPDSASTLWAVVDRWEPDADGTGKHQVFDHIAVTNVGVVGNKSDWTDASTGLPREGTCKIDVVAPGGVTTMFAAISAPSAGKELAVYRSLSGGAIWDFVCDYPANNNDYWKVMYNPFIRVDPKDPNYVYVAGTQLYLVDVGKALAGQSDHTQTIPSGNPEGLGHPDIKKLVWLPVSLPGSFSSFWVLSDGGIWQVVNLVTIRTEKPRNNDLRTVQFYYLDCSASNPNLMIGGTQDNDMARYMGSPTWDNLGPEGDTSCCRISPLNNQRMYMEGQTFGALDDQGNFHPGLHRTDNGLAATPGWNNAAGSGSSHLPDVKNAFYMIDPANDNHLLTEGDQVYETTNAGSDWHPVGPVADLGQAPVRGNVTRVLFQPGMDSQTWMAGTSGGQLWYHTGAGWKGIFDHPGLTSPPDGAQVVSMAFAPTDNRVLYVLFGTGKKEGRVYRFELKGNVWTYQAISTYLPTNLVGNVVCGDAYKPTVVYLGTDHGVWRGERQPGLDYTWTPYNDGLPLVEVKDLVVDKTSGELRAGTNGRGAWAVKTGP